MDLNQYLRYQFKQPYWVLRNEIYKKHVYNKNGIAHFYCFETGELADEVVVPDGCADIIFRCNEDEPDMILAVAGDKALRVIYPSNCYFFGVRLIPGAYYSLGNIANYYNTEVIEIMNIVSNTRDENVLHENYNRR